MAKERSSWLSALPWGLAATLGFLAYYLLTAQHIISIQVTTGWEFFLFGAVVIVAYFVYKLYTGKRARSVFEIRWEFKKAMVKQYGIYVEPSRTQVKILSDNDYILFVPEEGGCYRMINSVIVEGAVPGTLHEYMQRFKDNAIDKLYASALLKRRGEEEVLTGYDEPEEEANE